MHAIRWLVACHVRHLDPVATDILVFPNGVALIVGVLSVAAAMEVVIAALAGRHTRIAKEECLPRTMDVHCPEHGADVRETFEGEVDVRSAHAHEKRGDAVRHAIRAVAHAVRRFVEIALRIIIEIRAKADVLPARDVRTGVVEVVGGRRIDMHRRHRVDVCLGWRPLLDEIVLDARARLVGKHVFKSDELRNFLSTIAIGQTTILTKILPSAIIDGAERIDGQSAGIVRVAACRRRHLHGIAPDLAAVLRINHNLSRSHRVCILSIAPTMEGIFPVPRCIVISQPEDISIALDLRDHERRMRVRETRIKCKVDAARRRSHVEHGPARDRADTAVVDSAYRSVSRARREVVVVRRKVVPLHDLRGIRCVVVEAGCNGRVKVNLGHSEKVIHGNAIRPAPRLLEPFLTEVVLNGNAFSISQHARETDHLAQALATDTSINVTVAGKISDAWKVGVTVISVCDYVVTRRRGGVKRIGHLLAVRPYRIALRLVIIRRVCRLFFTAEALVAIAAANQAGILRIVDIHDEEYHHHIVQGRTERHVFVRTEVAEIDGLFPCQCTARGNHLRIDAATGTCDRMPFAAHVGPSGHLLAGQLRECGGVEPEHGLGVYERRRRGGERWSHADCGRDKRNLQLSKQHLDLLFHGHVQGRIHFSIWLRVF